MKPKLYKIYQTRFGRWYIVGGTKTTVQYIIMGVTLGDGYNEINRSDFLHMLASHEIVIETEERCLLCGDFLFQLSQPSVIYGCTPCHATWRMVDSTLVREKSPLDRDE